MASDPDPTDWEFDVFLSYSRRDQPIVRALAERLKADGLRVWFDDWQILPGQSIVEAIQQGLDSSRVLILFMSEHAFASDWSRLERQTILFLDPINTKRRLIPLRLDNAPIPTLLRPFAFLDWRTPTDAVYQRLLQACQSPGTFLAETTGAVVSPPLRVICPLHGIRTHAEWQRELSDLAVSRGWICRLDRWSYGRFSILAFVNPWSREAMLGWLRHQYDAEIHDRRLEIEQGQTPSVVAHSFGTYILGYTLLRFDVIRFNKVILCGSILPRDFPWDRIIERGQVQAVRNEYGVHDPWVKRVTCFVRGTGPSGALGFTRAHPRLEQEEFEFDHGEYFDKGHMEDRWLPFLDRPLPEIARVTTGPRIARPKSSAPRCLYGVLAALLLLSALLLTLAGLEWRRRAYPPPPPPPPPAVLSGLVVDDQGHLLSGVTITIVDWETVDGRDPILTTDRSGRFQFRNLKPGARANQPVKLFASKPGYAPVGREMELGWTDQPIRLKPNTESGHTP